MSTPEQGRFAGWEGKMWLPDRSKTLLHKPGDSYYLSTKCGIQVEDGETVRATDHHAGFLPCGDCWPDARLASEDARECPTCGKERPPTGGAFCSRYCELVYEKNRREAALPDPPGC